MAHYDESLKAQAIATAQAAGAAEASRATGIPAGTIRCWLHRLQRNGATEGGRCNVATQRETEKLRALQETVVERAVEEASSYIADRLKGLADRLYALADKAVGKVDVAISDQTELPKGKQGESHDRDGAAWVRALVGVMAQSIDKAQLLSGKPTARPEVMNRHEYEITERIITERPELLDAVFEDSRRGLEDRGRPGARAGLGELR
ncbi:MAG: hypothetical protein ACM3ZU_08045 [Bacteroidota bacterium]